MSIPATRFRQRTQGKLIGQAWVLVLAFHFLFTLAACDDVVQGKVKKMSIRNFFKPAAGALSSPGGAAATTGSRLAAAAKVTQAPTPKRFKSSEVGGKEDAASQEEKGVEDSKSTLTAEERVLQLDNTAAEVQQAWTWSILRWPCLFEGMPEEPPVLGLSSHCFCPLVVEVVVCALFPDQEDAGERRGGQAGGAAPPA